MNLTPKTLLTDTSVGDLCVSALTRTNKTGDEHGFVLTRHDTKLYHTPLQSGADGSITLQYNGDPVATAHTHPREQYESLFSGLDIQSYINGPMQFAYLIYDTDHHTTVDIYQTDAYDTYSDLREDIPHDTHLQLLRKANELLHHETIQLGKW